MTLCLGKVYNCVKKVVTVRETHRRKVQIVLFIIQTLRQAVIDLSFLIYTLYMWWSLFISLEFVHKSVTTKKLLAVGLCQELFICKFVLIFGGKYNLFGGTLGVYYYVGRTLRKQFNNVYCFAFNKFIFMYAKILLISVFCFFNYPFFPICEYQSVN